MLAMRRKKHSSAKRKSIAELAARLMAEEGFTNHLDAKRKAAERLGIRREQEFPDNNEIEASLSHYQRLFLSQAQAEHIYNKRKTALAAMQMLASFSPRLVGPVLSGTASEHSAITLHLFTDTPEEVSWRLTELAIPHELEARRQRQNVNSVVSYPCYRFMAGEAEVELVVFPHKELRQAPLSPLDGKPMRRADLAAVESLLTDPTALSQHIPGTTP